MMGELGHLDYVAKCYYEKASLSIILSVNTFKLGVEKCSLASIGVWYLYTVRSSKYAEFRG